MKRVAGLGLVVIVVPMLQGAIAPFLPAAARPDFSLLVVLGLSLCWRSTAGALVLAALSGFAVDLFSGGLVGQHALLSLLAFGLARVLSLHVNLIGPLPQMTFAAVLTVAHAVALAGLTSFFTPGAGMGLLRTGDLLGHALANAILAPFVTAGVSLLVGWLGDDEGGRRSLRLEPRNWAA